MFKQLGQFAGKVAGGFKGLVNRGAQKLHDIMPDNTLGRVGKRALVIGGGFLGLEIVSHSAMATDSAALTAANALAADATTIFGLVTTFLLVVLGFYIMFSIVKGLKRK